MGSLRVGDAIELDVKSNIVRSREVLEQLDRVVADLVDCEQISPKSPELTSRADETMRELCDVYAQSKQPRVGTLDGDAALCRGTHSRRLHAMASMPAMSMSPSRQDSAVSLMTRRNSLLSVIEISDCELYASSPTVPRPSDEKEVCFWPQMRRSEQDLSSGMDSPASTASWKTALCLPDAPTLDLEDPRSEGGSGESRPDRAAQHIMATETLAPPIRPPPPPPRNYRRPRRPVDSIASAKHNRIDKQDDFSVAHDFRPSCSDETPPSLLAEHRLHAIVHAWNRRAWTQAELLLREHLRYCVAASDCVSTARARHLLAVCASLKGNWEEAIRRFVSNLERPINSTQDLDTGVCASAYWLGDLYAMHNRRDEALLAYCIAGYRTTSAPRELVSTDQITIRLGLSKAEFKERWLGINARRHWPRDKSSILNPMIVKPEVAEACLDSSADYPITQGVEPNGCRGSRLYIGGDNTITATLQQQALTISWESFQPSSPWPLPYDPLFSISNVRIGRLLAYDCDILAVLSTNPETKLPRTLKTTYKDISWLIPTLRKCLSTLKMSSSEVVNAKCFYVDILLCKKGLHRFTISLLRF